MNIKDIKIRNAYSEKDDIVFTYREGNRRRLFKVPEFDWYFCVTIEDFKNRNNIFKNLQEQRLVYKYEKSGMFVKVFCERKGAKPDSPAFTVLKMLSESEIKTYEADLNPIKRFLADNDAEISDEYDILYFDIETDDTTRRIEIGKHRILSFAGVDREGTVYYFDDKDEKDLLNNILATFRKYDVITGWNISGFDLPYIRGYTKFFKLPDGTEKRQWVDGRMQVHDLKFDWFKMPNVDMMNRARRIFKEGAALKSYSLDNVSKYFLGKGKVKFEGKIIDLYTNNRPKLKEYNIQDAMLLKELDEKTGMLDMIGVECKMGKSLMLNFKGEYVSEILDSLILRECHKQKIYAPSKLKREGTQYAGGLVFEPKVGLHRNVYVFDYSSLYPSIIISSNIGFDTILNVDAENCIINPGTGVKFRNDKQSIISTVVEKLVQERQVYKQKRLEMVAAGEIDTKEYKTARSNEVIVKELSNSIYGLMGDQKQRYYSTLTAESITKTGHFLLNFARDFFNRVPGCEVIYGDTDSIFVKSQEKLDVEKWLESYHKALAQELKWRFNIQDSRINLKYEKLYESIIILEKKYYAGRVIEIEGKKVKKFDAKGLDLVKKSTIPLALESQQTIIEMLFDDKPTEEIKDYILNQKLKIMEGTFTFDEIKIQTKLARDLSEYTAKNAPHIKLARKLIERDGYLENTEIEYVVTNNEADKETYDGLALREEYVGDFDRNYYWNNRLFEPIKRILDIAHTAIDWSEFRYKKDKRSKLNKIPEGQGVLF